MRLMTTQGDTVFILSEERLKGDDKNKMPKKFSSYLCARTATRPYASTLIMRDLGREGLWVEL